MEAVDVLIVGGGPAGASAAIYAARAGLETLVVDRGLGTGAARLIRELENYPGVVSTSGEELLETMHRQAKSFGARFAQDRITGVDLDQEIKTAYGNLDLYSGRALIIATGSMERASSVPGEEELIGRGSRTAPPVMEPSSAGRPSPWWAPGPRPWKRPATWPGW